MAMNMSFPWISFFLKIFFNREKKHLDIGTMKEKKIEKQYMLAKQELCLFS